MKKKELRILEDKLLAYLPGFSVHRELLVLSPVGPILRGISFDGSVFDKTSLSVTAFLMPLCVPADHLFFNFGIRIRDMEGGDRWSTTNPDLISKLGNALRLQAVPFLSRVTSLLDFVEMARTFPVANPNTRKAIAYSLARSGRVTEAVEVLDRLLEQLDMAISWQQALADEAKRLKMQLTTHPMEALRELQAHESEAAQKLGLKSNQR